ncbi:hypothetical protein D3C73_1292420 [compost metagenome]
MGDAVEFGDGPGWRNLQGAREDRCQLVDPGVGQSGLAFGEPEDGALLGQCQGKGRATGLRGGQLRAGEQLFAVDHQCTGGQVTEALEVGVLQATDGAKEVAERQHVDKSQQVTQQ